VNVMSPRFWVQVLVNRARAVSQASTGMAIGRRAGRGRCVHAGDIASRMEERPCPLHRYGGGGCRRRPPSDRLAPVVKFPRAPQAAVVLTRQADVLAALHADRRPHQVRTSTY
jgi:hypothetical protein